MTGDEILQTCVAIDQVLLGILDPTTVSGLITTATPPTLSPALLAHACRDLANICGAQQQIIDAMQAQIDSLLEAQP